MEPLDIKGLLAGVFETAQSGAVASGTFSAELASIFDTSSGGAVPTGTFADELAAAFAKPERRAHRKTRPDDFQPQSGAERQRNYRQRKGSFRKDCIAVLDMETDPFDNDARTEIKPFVAELYSDRFEKIVIWEEDENEFIRILVETIEALPDSFTIYAHNGGKFDFMFLISRLRGEVSFKGRGIMNAKIGNHQLRDSFHLIPEKLAAFQKDNFDYTKLYKHSRDKYRDEILTYLHNDCVYLFDIIKSFVGKHGLKISIGQASMMLLKREYPEIQTVKENQDEFLRQFFFGGRVECIAGAGDFEGEYKVYDVNSMYPDCMANAQHPISSTYEVRAFGEIRSETCFVDVTCYSHGAFACKLPGTGTSFPHEFGRYKTTVHEYLAAEELGLIERVQINSVIDNAMLTDFSRYINPLYEGRARTKEILEGMRANGDDKSPEYIEVKKDNIFMKFFMNNGYGKFAQNPRRFKEYWISDPDGFPGNDPDDTASYGLIPEYTCASYAIWARPIKTLKFNNVGTAASITGAARAKLMRAKHAAKNPIYCDTDSLICEELSGVEIDHKKLGAWKLELETNKVRIAGKKLYGYFDGEKQIIKSKGVNGVTWDDLGALLAGATITKPAFGPTLTRKGDQAYIDRRISLTTKLGR
jgi:hypothetical protein